MCIERLPPSNFMGSTGTFTTEVPVEIPDIDTDYDIDDESDDEYNLIDESSEWNDYLWMENEQEFEQEEIRRLEEEELANQCMEAMSEMLLFDEITQVEVEQHKEWVVLLLLDVVSFFYQSFFVIYNPYRSLSALAQKSNLNPFAEEFFPSDAVLTYIYNWIQLVT